MEVRLPVKIKFRTEALSFFLFVIITIFAASISDAHAINLNNPTKDNLQIKADSLKQLYTLATCSHVNKAIYEKQFFDEFPATFNQLNDLYGDKENKPAILNNEAENHIIGLFNKITSVNDTVYYGKIIGIGIGGLWDADAVNYFQHGLRERVENNVALTIYLLKKLKAADIKSFWFFYFDGPHPKKQIPDALEKVKLLDKEIYSIMIEAHNEVLSQKE